VGPRDLRVGVVLGLHQLRVEVDGGDAGAEHQALALGFEPGEHLAAQPLQLLGVLGDVGAVHRVVQDDEVGALAVNLRAHPDGLDVRVLLVVALVAGGAHVGAEDDAALGPALRGGLPAPVGGVGLLELDEVRAGEPLLDRVQEVLGQRRAGRDDEDAEARVHAQPVDRVVHRDGHGLGVEGRDVDEDAVALARLVGLRGVQIPRGAALQHVDPLELVPEGVGLQVLRAPLGERQALSPDHVTVGLAQLAGLVAAGPEVLVVLAPGLVGLARVADLLQGCVDEHAVLKELDHLVLRGLAGQALGTGAVVAPAPAGATLRH
jgi:hypothetical protein